MFYYVHLSDINNNIWRWQMADLKISGKMNVATLQKSFLKEFGQESWGKEKQVYDELDAFDNKPLLWKLCLLSIKIEYKMKITYCIYKHIIKRGYGVWH